MDAKVRFDDDELEAAKLALGTRSNRKAINAVMQAGMKAVHARLKATPETAKRARARTADKVFDNVPDAIGWMKSL